MKSQTHKTITRLPAVQVVRRQPVGVNEGKVISFALDGIVLVRRLVITTHQPDEISVASSVGAHLLNAQPGQEMQVHTLEGDLIVKVLSILDSLPEMAAT